jgi:D-arabinose 5-phosphate isomerase GutQ
MKLMKTIPESKTIVVVFSWSGESSMLELVLIKFRETHK